jgi:type I restriction enzyme, S subunit
VSFTEVRIDEIATMKYGKMPPKSVLSDEGYPIYSGYRITGTAKEYLYKEPMLVLVARGVGGTGDVKISPPEAWITNLSIVLTLNDQVDQKYLFYKLGREALKEKLNTGAAQAQITIENLSPYKIKIHSLDKQHRIASILSSYDDLYENNRRRIALLEEAARQLYREWFVRFRFPGHEHVKIIDGVPEGWDCGTLFDFYATASGGTPSRKKSEFYTGDINWVKTQELKGGVLLGTDEKITEDAISKSSAKLFPRHTVLVAMYGATIGQTSILSEPSCCNQACCALKPKSENSNFIHAYLFLNENKSGFVGLGKGAAQNNISQEIIKNYTMVMPKTSIMDQFVDMLSPAFKQIEVLTKQISQLTQARDILLPKLMSGEIEV